MLSDGHSTDVERAWFYLDACIQGKPCAFSIKTGRRTVSATPKIPHKIKFLQFPRFLRDLKSVQISGICVTFLTHLNSVNNFPKGFWCCFVVQLEKIYCQVREILPPRVTVNTRRLQGGELCFGKCLYCQINS